MFKQEGVFVFLLVFSSSHVSARKQKGVEQKLSILQFERDFDKTEFIVLVWGKKNIREN